MVTFIVMFEVMFEITLTVALSAVELVLLAVIFINDTILFSNKTLFQ